MTNKTTRFLLLLFTDLMSFGCLGGIDGGDNSPENIPDEIDRVDTISYLALGDSYTIGEGVADSLRWPVQLAAKLSTEHDDFIEKVDIIAKTGWRTDNLIDAIANANTDGYNLVSLLIGVNNQFQGIPFDVYEQEFPQLLQTAIQIAGSKERVFVVSIPDYGVTPFGQANAVQIAEELDRYNAFAKLHSEQIGVPFISITEISRELGDGAGALAPDRLHPSGQQYAAWVEQILPAVKTILK